MMALESGTSHPIAKAMVYYGEDHGYKGKAVELESFGDVPGKGLQGAYQGVSVQLGHSRWMSELGYDLSKGARMIFNILKNKVHLYLFSL